MSRFVRFLPRLFARRSPHARHGELGQMPASASSPNEGAGEFTGADVTSVEQSGDSIRDAELILVAFRTLLLFLLAAAPFFFEVAEAYETRSISLIAIAGVYNVAMAIAALRPERFGVRRPFVVAMDTMLITAWLHFSMRWEIISFYYVVIVVASMWFRVFGGLLAAAVCNFLFVFLWARAAADPQSVSLPPFTSAMAVNAALFFVIAALAGYIAEAQDRERERRLERELLIANFQSEIDLSGAMQPTLIRPEAAGHLPVDLGVAFHAARSFGGGDYVDAIVLGRERLLLCVADVSGKSVRAQARVPLLKYSLRALAPLHESPEELAARLQRTLLPDLAPDLYIAMCLIVVDFANGRLSWCNAGHIPPLLVSAPRSARPPVTHPLTATAPALGLFPEVEPRKGGLAFEKGDLLLLYTDGLTDALSLGGTVDGEDQLARLLQSWEAMRSPLTANAPISSNEPTSHTSLTMPEATDSSAAQGTAERLLAIARAATEEESFVARHFTLGEKIAPALAARRDDIAILAARLG